MLTIAKTLRSRIAGNKERVLSLSLPLFTHMFIKPVSLLVAMFFSPRIIAAEVVVENCIIYSSTQKF